MTADARSALLTGVGRGLAEEIGRSGRVTGVGIDAVEIERFARVLARRTGMADRLFTPGELAYARAASDPVPRLSTRFTAKEAAMKALGVGLGAFPFHDVEVVRDGLDAPRLVLHGSALGPGPPRRCHPVAPLAHPHRADGPGRGGGRRHARAPSTAPGDPEGDAVLTPHPAKP